MRYSPTIKYLLDIIARSSKSILRDYNEMVHMQSSVRATDEFVKKSVKRSADLMNEEIANQRKYTPNVLMGGGFKDIKSKYTVIIEPLDGIKNFQHAIPFFSLAASLKDEEKNEIVASVIEVPALREVYFAEKNNGAWHDSFLNSAGSGSRLKVSKRSSFSDMYFSSDIYIASIAERTLILHSPLLAAVMMSFGRLDACIFKGQNHTYLQNASLIVSEAGGSYFKENGLSIFATDLAMKGLKNTLGEL